jgi:hypothetical protein
MYTDSIVSGEADVMSTSIVAHLRVRSSTTWRTQGRNMMFEIEVLTDHPSALEIMPAQAARLGYVAEIEAVGTAKWSSVLRKG